MSEQSTDDRRQGRRTPPQTRSRVLDLVRAGRTATEVARETGVSRSTVMRIADDEGVELAVGRTGPPPLHSDRDEEIRRRVAAGESLTEVGAAYGVSRQRVHTIVGRRPVP